MKTVGIETGGWYTDYYDFWFDRKDSSDVIWNRNDREFPNRTEQFKIMNKHFMSIVLSSAPQDYVVAWADTPYDMSKITGSIKDVVVYTDETMHMGLGKEILPLKEAVQKYPHCLATIFYENPFPEQGKSVSRRLLMIGKKPFLLEYISYQDWQSNVGDGDVNILDEEIPQQLINLSIDIMRELKSPLLAIDFVPQKLNNDRIIWNATDLNLAPGLKGSGMEKKLSGKLVTEELKKSYLEILEGKF